MGEDVTRRGYFSVLRWRTDATRDEARNIAIILVADNGRFAGVKHGPLSSVSPRLHEHGLLDAMLVGLEEQCRGERKPTLETLQQMRADLQRSLYLTEPKPLPVPDVGAVLEALYRAYIAPRTGPRAVTKTVVLDRVVATLRRKGLEIRRDARIEDFVFDAMLLTPKRRRSVMEVLSFATGLKDWEPVEHDAGHFLYALEQIKLKGIAVLQPPAEDVRNGASGSLRKVKRWMGKARVPTFAPGDLADADLESLVPD